MRYSSSPLPACKWTVSMSLISLACVARSGSSLTCAVAGGLLDVKG